MAWTGDDLRNSCLRPTRVLGKQWTSSVWLEGCALRLGTNPLTAGMTLAVPVCCLAATYEVPGDAGAIQGDIDLAMAGDTVRMALGTHTGAGSEDLDFGNRVRQRS